MGTCEAGRDVTATLQVQQAARALMEGTLQRLAPRMRTSYSHVVLTPCAHTVCSHRLFTPQAHDYIKGVFEVFENEPTALNFFASIFPDVTKRR